MDTGMVIFFALIFSVAILGILYSAFERWLQHKEKFGQLLADQTAEKAAQYAQQAERVEARLRVLEQIVTDGGAQTAEQIEALRDHPVLSASAASEGKRKDKPTA